MRRACFCFFFSSRRRHTRCLSDWSSDVCSSDLGGAQRRQQPEQQHRGEAAAEQEQERAGVDVRLVEPGRSEERRVGKECRSRGSPDQEKKRDTERNKKMSERQNTRHEIVRTNGR